MDLSRSFAANSEIAAYVRKINSLFGGDIGSIWAARLTSCLEGIYASTGGPAAGRACLSDAIFLGSGVNVGTGGTALTLRGRSVELGGTTTPTWGPEGVRFDGVSQYARVLNLPNTRTGTIVIVAAGDYTGQTDNGSILALCNSAGIDTSTALTLIWAGTKAAGSVASAYTRQGGAATTTIGIVATNAALGMAINEGSFHCYALTNDNAGSPTLNAYVDGNLSMNDAAGNTQASSSCTTLVFPCWLVTGALQNFCKFTVQAVLVFNRVLTAAEISGVNRSLQYVQPEDFILAVEGDSTSYFNNSPAANPAPGSEWPAVLKSALGGNLSRWRVQNWASSGDTTTNMLATWASQLQQQRPGGRYRDGAVMIWGGINDLLVGTSGATIYNTLVSIWAIARENGYKVIAGTLMPGAGYTGPQNTQRLDLNSRIRAANGLYDVLIEGDTLFPDTAGSYFFDGFHLNPTGYATLAAEVRRKLRI